MDDPHKLIPKHRAVCPLAGRCRRNDASPIEHLGNCRQRVSRFRACVQCNVDQASSHGISRRKEASARGIPDLWGTATMQATYRRASDGRAFARQTVAPMSFASHVIRSRPSMKNGIKAFMSGSS